MRYLLRRVVAFEDGTTILEVAKLDHRNWIAIPFIDNEKRMIKLTPMVLVVKFRYLLLAWCTYITSVEN